MGKPRVLQTEAEFSISLLSPTFLFFFFSLSMSVLLSSPPTLIFLFLFCSSDWHPLLCSACVVQKWGANKRCCRSSLAVWELQEQCSHTTGPLGHWWDCPRQSRTIVSYTVCYLGIVLHFRKGLTFELGPF